MDINQVKSRLTEEGFYVYETKDDSLKASLSYTKDEDTGLIILEKPFRVQATDGKIKISYLFYQTGESKEYGDIEAFIGFVKDELPSIP